MPMTTDTPYPLFDRPERIAEIWIQAWNRRDPERLAALFDEDAEFVNVTGLWWTGRASIRKAHAYGLTTIFGGSTLALLRTKVKWLIGDSEAPPEPAVAVVHAKMRLEGQTPVAGIAEPGARRNLFSFVVHRTAEGSWSCALAHNTDVTRGTETNVVDQSGQLRPVSYREEASSAGKE